MPPWVMVFSLVTSYALLGVTKYWFVRHALRDVPPEQRVEVIDAIGRTLEKWRWR